jgi:lipopolysaccharide/colanic/teichoic acid biosynthesis glycosyltransferase
MLVDTTTLHCEGLERELSDCSQSLPIRRLAYLVAKRLVDIVLTPLLICAAAPIVGLAAILIICDSEGPAIFVQKRVGARYQWKRGRIVWQIGTFNCYKLRTMRSNADESIHRDYLERFRHGSTDPGPEEAPFKLSRDQRITPIGRLLRKASLDELPQLWNVIQGDMSLVGPRPVPVYEVAMYGQDDYMRLSARPGITGMWQVYGRSRVTFAEMVQMDSHYVQQSSIFLDFRLLVLTLQAVVSSRGAV